MNIKHEYGVVTYLMRTGKDLVRGKMTIASAMGTVNNGESVVQKDGQIIVDDKYFFPADISHKSRKKKTEDNE